MLFFFSSQKIEPRPPGASVDSGARQCPIQGAHHCDEEPAWLLLSRESTLRCSSMTELTVGIPAFINGRDPSSPRGIYQLAAPDLLPTSTPRKTSIASLQVALRPGRRIEGSWTSAAAPRLALAGCVQFISQERPPDCPAQSACFDMFSFRLRPLFARVLAISDIGQ
jgi:hypothetical protein